MEIITTKRENGSRRVQINTGRESKVEQSHKNECNINTIVAKAHKSGLFPTRTDSPKYGDFSGAMDFHEAHNRINDAQRDFMLLPSEIRNRFENNAGKLIDFINNPDNVEEAIKLGIVPKPAKEEIVQPEAAKEVKTDDIPEDKKPAQAEQEQKPT